MPDPMITMPDGTEVALTDELYNQIIYSDEYDRDFKALCNQTKLEKQVPFVKMCIRDSHHTVPDDRDPSPK